MNSKPAPVRPQGPAPGVQARAASQTPAPAPQAPDRRGVLLCSAWIAAILLLGGGLWFGTAPYRSRLLAERVNRVLAAGTDRRRAAVPAAGFRPVLSSTGGPGVMGVWYPVVNAAGNASGTAGNGGERVFVFTMIRPGAAACAAFVDENGAVKSIVPLSGSATQIAGGLPLPLYDFYAARVEGAARLEAARTDAAGRTAEAAGRAAGIQAGGPR